jgi:iron complex outermembrane receptor protein
LTDTIHSEQQQYGFSFEGTVMALPAGDMRAAFGYEYREEEYDFRPDGAKVKRQVTGNKGAGTEGAYDVSSF